jgi:hypothetical protein
MPREVTDRDGITWTCIQAFSGLGKDPEKTEAARVNGKADAFQVVCTPSGGAQSVRIAGRLGEEDLRRATRRQDPGPTPSSLVTKRQSPQVRAAKKWTAPVSTSSEERRIRTPDRNGLKMFEADHQ